jgi:hypothetical protein
MYLLICYICIKKNSSIIQIGRSQRHVPKGLKECLNINCCYLLTHWFTPSTSSAMRTPENKEEDPEPADEEDIPVDYYSD